MEMMRLLQSAREMGVQFLITEDAELVIRGPKRAESVVRDILARRDEALDVLRPRSCQDCGANAGSGASCGWCAAARVPRQEVA